MARMRTYADVCGRGREHEAIDEAAMVQREQ
jgi:hypothetical protein